MLCVVSSLSISSSRALTLPNRQGVRIYDTASSQRITYISRPEDSPRADLFKCTLHWQDDRTLLIAWADMIKIATVRERESKRSLAAVPGVGGVIGASSELYAEVTAIFQVDCMVSGIAPYGSNGDLLVLAYLTEDDFDDETAVEDRDQQRRKEAIMPELRIISSEGEELSSDAISLRNYARFQCRDYSLVPTADGKAFYVVAPLDVVVVQTRDEEDHIVWLIEQQRYEEALHALEKSGTAAAGGFDVGDVGKRYLEFLVDDGTLTALSPLPMTPTDALLLQVNTRRRPKRVPSSSVSTPSYGRTGSSCLPTKDSSRCAAFLPLDHTLAHISLVDHYPLHSDSRSPTRPPRLRDGPRSLPPSRPRGSPPHNQVVAARDLRHLRRHSRRQGSTRAVAVEGASPSNIGPVRPLCLPSMTPETLR